MIWLMVNYMVNPTTMLIIMTIDHDDCTNQWSTNPSLQRLMVDGWEVAEPPTATNMGEWIDDKVDRMLIST